jgi:hypothetical protein
MFKSLTANGPQCTGGFVVVSKDAELLFHIGRTKYNRFTTRLDVWRAKWWKNSVDNNTYKEIDFPYGFRTGSLDPISLIQCLIFYLKHRRQYDATS